MATSVQEEKKEKEGTKNCQVPMSPIIICVILAVRGLKGPWALIWSELYINRRPGEPQI